MSPPAPPTVAERPSLAARTEAFVLRGVFVGLLVFTVVVLGRDLQEQLEAAPITAPDAPLPQAEPYLPSARPGGGEREPRGGGTPAERLREPMTLELLAGGRLEAVGTITPGTAERLADEFARRGDYVETVVLESPGGSVQDALAMSRLIRERKLDTAVEAGALCASSCPLVLAGGVQRRAAADAAIGVHQVTTVRPAGLAMPGAEPEMVGAQRVSAEIQRHLVDMGVDAAVWFHAMETPPREMYYFTVDELAELKLAERSAD